MIVQELESYFQELDDTIEEAKKEYEIDNFAKNCKKALDKAMVKYINMAQDTIVEFHSHGDLYKMNMLMEQFSTMIDKFMLDAKMGDCVYKAQIYQMNSCSEIDSTLALGKDYKLYIKN